MDEELIIYLLKYGKKLPEEFRALNRVELSEDMLNKVIQEKKEMEVSLNSFFWFKRSKITLENRYEKFELFYGFNDEKTNALVLVGNKMGIKKFKRYIAERILNDQGDNLINNCPKCGKLLRTPYAKQCRHCNIRFN